jgi:hypothetical protein
MYITEDDPSISLKLTFDQMTPEFYNFMYLLTILSIFATIYLFLLVLEFLTRYSFVTYRKIFKNNTYTRIREQEDTY